MIKQKSLSRRDLLRTMGAAAFLAACSDGAKLAGPNADAGGTTDAAGTQDVGASDAAAHPEYIPHITANKDHYITSYTPTPIVVNPKDWTLTFLDRGTPLGKLDLAFLAALPAREKEHTLECISAGTSNPAISNAIWTGLPLTEILAALKIAVPAGTKWLKGTAADNYTTAIPVSDLDRPVWLVWKMNGEPLPAAHGFPVRVLTPGRYGMKGPKWLVSLDFIDTPYVGLWEKQGWSDDASYRPNTMIRTLESGGTVAKGLHHVAGTAFAGSDPVVRVEVQVDVDGWQDAVLDYAPGADIWVLWHWDWDAKPGNHIVQARCTTKSGAMSAVSTYGDKGLNGYDGSMAVTIDVT